MKGTYIMDGLKDEKKWILENNKMRELWDYEVRWENKW